MCSYNLYSTCQHGVTVKELVHKHWNKHKDTVHLSCQLYLSGAATIHEGVRNAGACHLQGSGGCQISHCLSLNFRIFSSWPLHTITTTTIMTIININYQQLIYIQGSIKNQTWFDRRYSVNNHSNKGISKKNLWMIIF